MGNCCKKSQRQNQKNLPLPKKNREPLLEDDNFGKHVASSFDDEASNPSTRLSEKQKNYLDFFRSLELEKKLDTVQEELEKVNLEELKKISKETDTFSLWFNVLSEPGSKEKYHSTLMVLESKMSPLEYKLANSLISEEDELRISDSYEQFKTPFRVKDGDIYYIMNYALYKKILMFSKKDLLFVKAFKVLDNGDVLEVTVSVEHPDYPISEEVERMSIIQNVVLYRKTENGCEIKSFNSLYPKTNAGSTMLNGIFSKSYRTYNKLLAEYLEALSKSEQELEAEFIDFVPENI